MKTSPLFRYLGLLIGLAAGIYVALAEPAAAQIVAPTTTNVSWTPPTSNTDTWDLVAKVSTAEVN